ncbi:MAG: diguanylate cyclase [Actinomycetes bacterium]
MTSPERPSTRPLDGPLEIDLRRRVDTMLTAPAEATRHVCILVLSIDDTDGIRSMHGDAIAEEVLESVRWRARSVIRSSDLLSLSDNDELVIVLRGLRDLHDAQTVSAKIQRCIGEPIVVRDHKFHISTTAGMAMADDDETAITLTQQMREALLTRPAR